MNQKLITSLFIIATFIIILSVFIFLREEKADVETSKCIGGKSLLYIKTGCSHCKVQEDLFGENFKYLNVRNCADTPEKCTEITAVPTWIINEKEYFGIQSIDKLKELTGC